MLPPAQRVVLITSTAGQGTGVRLTDTLVITCEHVVTGAKKPMFDGLECLCVIATDKKADLVSIPASRSSAMRSS